MEHILMEHILNFEEKASSTLFKNNTNQNNLYSFRREHQFSTTCLTTLSPPRWQCANIKKKKKKKKRKKKQQQQQKKTDDTHACTHTHSATDTTLTYTPTLPPTDKLKKWHPLVYVLCSASFSLLFLLLLLMKTPTTTCEPEVYEQ